MPTVKRLILLFWAAWFTLVFATNLFDALKALGVVGQSWSFASGNWALVVATTRVHRTPLPIVAFLFAGVMTWEALSATLMWRAVISLRHGADQHATAAVDQAFTLALGLFAAFMLADEIWIAYTVEATHMRIFLTLLASLLAFHLLPDRRG